MREKIDSGIFICIALLTVILLFTVIDHAIHGLESAWKVPYYYFRNKIPFGFLWGIVGFFLGKKYKNVWLKALILAGTVAVTLQVKYFLESYAFSFVFFFLFIHFIIVYFLSLIMFVILEKYD